MNEAEWEKYRQKVSGVYINAIRESEQSGVFGLRSYVGNWGRGEGFTASTGKNFSIHELWEFIGSFKYMCKLSNLRNEDGDCLLRYNGKPLKRCLELGCDWGHCFSVFESCFEEVYGIEALKSSAELGQKKGKNIICGVLENMPYEDNFFDAVFSSHVLEHALSPDIALPEIHRVTKTGGYSVHSMPCRITNVPSPATEVHVMQLSWSEWLNEFKEHKFDIINYFFMWNGNEEDFTIIAKKQ